MHPLTVAAARHFLGHASAVQLHLTQIISVEAGETRQKLHRDEMAFDFFQFGPHYQVQCNTMWALTDFHCRKRGDLDPSRNLRPRRRHGPADRGLAG